MPTNLLKGTADTGPSNLLAGAEDEPKEDPAYRSFYDKMRGSIGTAAGNLYDAVSDPMAGVKNVAAMAGAQASTDSAEGQLRAANQIAASTGRSVTELLDFFGPGSFNALMRLTNTDLQVPEITETAQSMKYPIGVDVMEPGIGKDAADFAGQALLMGGAAVPVAGRNVGTLAGATAELAGAGTAAPSTAVARQLALARGQGDVAGAGYKLEPRAPGGMADDVAEAANRVVKDPLQRKVTKQGFEPATVAMIQSSNRATKNKYLQMLDLVRAGKRNVLNRMQRPSDVLGESVLDRVNIVRVANRAAGKELDSVAKNLKGKTVDTSGAIGEFIEDLKAYDVVFDEHTMQPHFYNSMFEGMDDLQGVISRVIRRLTDTRHGPGGTQPSAWDAHRAKKYIDTQVTFGKSTGGLSGQVEGIFKKLRRNIDSQLDAKFDDYNRVNTQYSETIQALDNLQQAMGTKIDFFADNAQTAVGTAMRKLLSNYASRQQLANSVNDIEAMAGKYLNDKTNEIVPYGTIVRNTGVKQLDDSVAGQVHMVNELESMFGTHAGQSFQGIQEKAVSRGVAKVVSPGETVLGFMDKAAHKMFGVNEENAIKALEDLLRAK